MKEFKGNKGPWAIAESWIEKHVGIDAPDHGAIALVLCDMDDDYSFNQKAFEEKRQELSANANLIAAAPDLLEALQDLYTSSFNSSHWSEQQLDSFSKARTAIAKALGETK